jgi:IS5 family transposase
MLTGGQVADCEAAKQLLERLPAARALHGDKGYGTDALRRQVEARDTLPNIPRRQTGSGRTASRPSSTAPAMPSSACSAA